MTPNLPGNEVDGDVGFIGVDERTHPAQLRPGYVSRAKNYRFRNGIAEPRGGDILLEMHPTDGMTTWSEGYGILRFEDPVSGQETQLVAADGGVYRCLLDNVAQSVPLEAGQTLTRANFRMFVQNAGKVILLRGDDLPPLELVDWDEGFRTVQQTNLGDSTRAIMSSEFGLFYGNRQLLVNDGDEIAASDLLDYTRYQPVFNDLRFNPGDDDRVRAIHPFGRGRLLVLKDQSIYSVTGMIGETLVPSTEMITKKYGCIAPFSVVDFGTDVAWLSDRGIVTLKLTAENEAQGTALSLSDPLVVTMRRLRWDLAGNVVAGYYDNKLYFAVPLDEANVIGDSELTSGSYDGSGLSTVSGLTVGATYRYRQGGNDTYLDDGGTEYHGDIDFVAENASVTLHGTISATVSASLKEVVATEVNNAVLVYDTVTQAWAGVDEREGLCVQRWTRMTVDGKLRLAYLSTTGELRLYEEEGAEDEVLSPVSPAYAEVVVADDLSLSETVQIGGGDIITVDTGATTNTASVCAAASSEGVEAIGVNLWEADTYGFNPGAANAWDAGSYTLQQITGGLRVIGSSTTVVDIKIGGVTQTTTNFHSAGLYLAQHSGSQVTPQAIATALTTRGYHGKPAFARFLDARVQLSTWDAKLTLGFLTDGVEEETNLITDETFDRSSNIGGEAGDYITTNANDDHATAGREDYSVVPDDGQVGVDLGSNGVDVEREQDYEWQGDLPHAEGRYLQLRVRNTQGRAALSATLVTSAINRREHGMKY